MIYKYSQIVAVLGITLLYNVTKQHYIPPPEFCAFAKTCNHTGVSICGMEKIHLNTRLFLDECDLFEYNCDNHKEYTETDTEKCSSNETVLNSTTISPISTIITLNISASIETTRASANTSEVVNTTMTESSTKSSSVSAEITTKITHTNSSSAKPCICPTVTCPVLNITTSMISQNVTSTSITASPVIVPINESTNNITNTEVATNLPNTESIINVTVTSTTVSRTPNSTKVALTTCTHRITTSNFTSSQTEEVTTKASTVPNSTINKEDGKSTTGKETKKSQDKCAYPKHCDRPSTWETTSKGETRDFYQILRAQFGDRVKLLRDTTHFPRRIVKDINDNEEGFQFGYHNERMNEFLLAME